MDDVGAIILAGGGATRMGGEKPLRMLRGRTLLEHAVEVCRALARRVVVAVGPREFGLPAGVIAAPDAPAHLGKGPLAGIAAGLEAVECPRAVVLACDLPNIPVALLRRLVAEARPCAYCEHAGHPEPLVCALEVAAVRPRVVAALGAGELRVAPLWSACGATVLRDSDLAEFAPLERTFANVNTLAELEREEQR